MQSSIESHRLAELAERPPAAELVKLIQKLRWIGMEEEARQLQLVLSRLPPDELSGLERRPAAQGPMQR